MNQIEYQNPFRSESRRSAEFTLVIFGATGDLTARKLMPGLYHLYRQNLLPSDFSIIGFARREKTETQFRHELAKIPQFSASATDQSAFLKHVHYFQGDFTQSAPYENLAHVLHQKQGNRLYYLATPPSQYLTIIDRLRDAGLASRHNVTGRIIIEKPFGNDVKSALHLNHAVTRVFPEEQIYRIDHYLGKETVQNILVFRFANGIFEPIWNRRYVDHIQITVAEQLGIEQRGKFFEETGILRDIVQNHMLQLLCLVAMEPPAAFSAQSVRDEKVKALRAVKPFTPQDVDQRVVRARYTAGSLLGVWQKGYLEEQDVSPASTTETFAALQLFLDNWRWAGVPFYLRTGKRLPKRVTEIAIQFKETPLKIFGTGAGEIAANVLTLNIQPDEGISLRFDSKVPGPSAHIRPVTMDFRYGTSFGEMPADAYERLLLDVINGDPGLFTRADETEVAWEILQPVLDRWQELMGKGISNYPVATWGPKEADELLQRDGRRWRRL